MDCKHATAKATENQDEYWCPECGDVFNLNDASDAGHTEVTSAAPAAKTKRSVSRKPRAKSEDRSPVPMGVLSEHLGSNGTQRTPGLVLPTITSKGVAATAEREAPADVPAAEAPGVETPAKPVARVLAVLEPEEQVKDFTSVDAEMPVGPWHGIPCPNRAHKDYPCAGIMETYRVIQAEKTGNSYWMKCPVDQVHVVLNFQSSDVKL